MNTNTTPEPVTVLTITGTDLTATSQAMSTQYRITRGTEYLGLVTPNGRTGHQGWWIVEGHPGLDFPSLQAAGEYLAVRFPAVAEHDADAAQSVAYLRTALALLDQARDAIRHTGSTDEATDDLARDALAQTVEASAATLAALRACEARP